MTPLCDHCHSDVRASGTALGANRHDFLVRTTQRLLVHTATGFFGCHATERRAGNGRFAEVSGSRWAS